MCNDADALMVVKELTPLRTMSYVDGHVQRKKKKEKKEEGDGETEKEPPPSAEAHTAAA